MKRLVISMKWQKGNYCPIPMYHWLYIKKLKYTNCISQDLLFILRDQIPFTKIHNVLLNILQYDGTCCFSQRLHTPSFTKQYMLIIFNHVTFATSSFHQKPRHETHLNIIKTTTYQGSGLVKRKSWSSIPTS